MNPIATSWPNDAQCAAARERALAALRAEFPRLQSEHEDLIQDAAIYIATWQKPPRDYPYELTQVALRRAVDLTRKQNRRAMPADPHGETLGAAEPSAGIGVGGRRLTPEEEAIRAEHCQMVRRVCRQLGEDEARALKLRFLEGHSIPEVMSQLGLARQSVYQRLEKACSGVARLLPTEICPDQQSRNWAELALRHRMGLCDEAEEAEYRRLQADMRFIDVDASTERTARGVGAVAPFVALSKASVGGPLAFVVRRLGHLVTGGGKGAGTAGLTAKNVAIAGAVIGVAAGGTYVAVKSGSHAPAQTPKPKVALVSAPASCGTETLSGITSKIRVEAGSVTCVEARRVFAALPGAFKAAANADPRSGQAGTLVLGWTCNPGGPGIFPVSRGQTCTKSSVRIAAIATNENVTGPASCGTNSQGVAVIVNSGTVSCAEAISVSENSSGPNAASGPTGWDCAQFATTLEGNSVLGADGWSCKSSAARISMIAPNAQTVQTKPPSSAPASSENCTASGLGEGGVSIQFTATGLSCADGEQVVRDALSEGFTGSSFEVDGFACGTESAPQPGSPVTCTSSSKKVEFSLPG